MTKFLKRRKLDIYPHPREGVGVYLLAVSILATLIISLLAFSLLRNSLPASGVFTSCALNAVRCNSYATDNVWVEQCRNCDSDADPEWCNTTLCPFSCQNGACVNQPVCTDNDSDGYGNPGDASCSNGSQTDCDDTKNYVYPGATETCDTNNNDCDANIDEGCDDDADKYCDKNMAMYNNNSMCLNTIFPGDGNFGNDCDDAKSNIYPGGTEIYNNNIDEDCSGADAKSCSGCSSLGKKCGYNNLIKEGDCISGVTISFPNNPNDYFYSPTCNPTLEDQANKPPQCCRDLDNDGFGDPGDTNCSGGSLTDCDDSNASINPGAAEACGNGKDDNCDGSIDEGCDVSDITYKNIPLTFDGSIYWGSFDNESVGEYPEQRFYKFTRPAACTNQIQIWLAGRSTENADMLLSSKDFMTSENAKNLYDIMYEIDFSGDNGYNYSDGNTYWFAFNASAESEGIIMMPPFFDSTYYLEIIGGENADSPPIYRISVYCW